MLFRRLAARLPAQLQQELRRWHTLASLGLGRFRSDEPEYGRLHEFVGEGDWVVDIGANRGEYTLRLSELVGPEGRVFAIEPVAATVEILAAAVRLRKCENVTILQLAASGEAGAGRLDMPLAESGLPDYRRARLGDHGDRPVYRLPLDRLCFPHRLALVKIDAEGHEDKVLDGMRDTLQRDRPVLLIEGHEGLIERLAPLGYAPPTRAEGSPNLVFLPRPSG